MAAWASYRAEQGYGDEFTATGGATLAVADSGIDRGHPEFADKIAPPPPMRGRRGRGRDHWHRRQ